MTTYPVTLYTGINYSDISTGLGYGSYPWAGNVGFPNDSLSSIKVAPFTKVSLYCDGDYGGCRFDLLGPVEVSDMRSMGFNDSMSSLQVISIEPSLAVKAGCCGGSTDAYQCGKYVPGSAACADAMTQYCSTNLNTPQCKAWCNDNSSICDQFIDTYCNDHPTDPYCACVKSPAKGIGGINPKCIDSACLNGGYLTTAMKNSNCPSIIDCSIQTTLANTGIIFSNTTPIQQNCGNTTIISPGGTTTQPGNATTSILPTVVTPQPTSTSSSFIKPVLNFIHDNIWLVIIFIMVVFMAILLSQIDFGGLSQGTDIDNKLSENNAVIENI